MPVSIAARSKALVYGGSPAEIVGSNPTEGMDICLWVLCVVRHRSLRRADHASRGVLLRRFVWSRNLENEEVMARVGPQRHGEGEGGLISYSFSLSRRSKLGLTVRGSLSAQLWNSVRELLSEIPKSVNRLYGYRISTFSIPRKSLVVFEVTETNVETTWD